MIILKCTDGVFIIIILLSKKKILLILLDIHLLNCSIRAESNRNNREKNPTNQISPIRAKTRSFRAFHHILASLFRSNNIETLVTIVNEA